MTFKRAFTLAEILIVLTVIGALATMTVPTMMAGIKDAQYKTAFKKAYNTISNIAEIEKSNGTLPQTYNDGGEGLKSFFTAMNNNLKVEEFSLLSYTSTDLATSSNTGTAVNYYGTLYGEGTSVGTRSSGYSPWIVAYDGIAYMLKASTGNAPYTCSTSAAVNAMKQADIESNVCITVVVDVNGLSKGPNTIEPQVNTNLSATKKLKTLTGDRFYIYLARDGVAKGSKSLTVSGRILADEK